MAYIDDGLTKSGEFIAVEEPDSQDHKQALWFRVAPVYHGPVQDAVPIVQICYQQEHQGSGLQGPVFLTPAMWRALNEAVEWRLDEWGYPPLPDPSESAPRNASQRPADS